MSFPNIPSVSPEIKITSEEAIKLLLASIAFEELGLAHIINAEAEKIQYVLGTIPGQITSKAPSFDEITSVDQTVERILRTVIKNQMLLQFKLEDVLNVFTSSSTTTTFSTTTSTTTSTCTFTTTSSTTYTTTTTSGKPCAPGLTYAVFANNNLCIAAQSLVNARTQVNGNLTVTHSGNNFLGSTNVVGAFTDTTGGNFYQNLILNESPVQFKTFNASCLVASADLIISKDVVIASAADASPFQGKTVWVKGSVSITGDNISITGGGILANDGINITGCNFTYTSTGCFALYSRTSNIRIMNGPYRITGLIYTTTEGDIRLAGCHGGTVCGALISGRDVILAGGNAVHQITNKCSCNPCRHCNNLCPTNC